MKLTIVAMEIPYPPIHGGRVDIWRRIEALKAVGVEIQLICWTPETPPVEDLAVMRQAIADLQLLDYVGRSPLSRLRRAWDLLHHPLGITSRMVYGERFTRLSHAVQAFDPALMLIDGIHASLLARQLAAQLGLPFALRSHNIEHQHRAALFQAAQGRQKISSFLMQRRMKALEFETFRGAIAFFDISIDDLKFWQEQGFDHGYFLPPLADFAPTAALPCPEQPPKAPFSKRPADPTDDPTDGPTDGPTYDIVFLGNLNTPNNVAGVKWFIDEVMPLLKAEKPNLSVLIAGSKPIPAIQDLCRQDSGIDLKANPKSASEIYQSGRVLINPIAVGGGVSLKSIDMLATGRPIVSLEKGLVGLPSAAKPLFALATDAASFAERVLVCLNQDPDSEASQARQALIQAEFGLPRIEVFVAQLEQRLHQHRQEAAPSPSVSS